MSTGCLLTQDFGTDSVAHLLAEARAGSETAKGQLLEICREHLRSLAARKLPRWLQSKIEPADIVQETLLEAFQDFPAFAGQSRDELLAWSRRILLNNLTDALRHYVDADKRSVNHEVSLEAIGARGDRDHLPVADGPSASASAVRHEEQRLLEANIATLPHDYAMVITLHHGEGLSFADIALRMDRSIDAARKLWMRAIARLQEALERDQDLV